MTSVVPDVDAYGTKARYEALADLLEVIAVCGVRSPSSSELADYVKDRGWLQKNYELLTETLAPNDDLVDNDPDALSEDSDSLGQESDTSHLIASQVFSLLKARASAYGTAYPFRLSAGRVRQHAHLNPGQRRYLALLALCFFHSHHVALDTGRPLTSLAEEIVGAALDAAGLRVAQLGLIRQTAGSFTEALSEVGQDLRLSPAPGGAVVSSQAQDAGVDIVGRLDFFDDGYGKWIFIGQVTCARSDVWHIKAQEPAPGRWRKLLGLATRPSRFLAVPHEIPETLRSFLCDACNEELLLLDRKRLVRPERHLLAAEQHLFTVLQTLEIEGF